MTAFIEISPFDFVKYEVEKRTGYLKVDRPQRGSSSPPTLYGLIPKTYCAERVAALLEPDQVELKKLIGDRPHALAAQ